MENIPSSSGVVLGESFLIVVLHEVSVRPPENTLALEQRHHSCVCPLYFIQSKTKSSGTACENFGGCASSTKIKTFVDINVRVTHVR